MKILKICGAHGQLTKNDTIQYERKRTGKKNIEKWIACKKCRIESRRNSYIKTRKRTGFKDKLYENWIKLKYNLSFDNYQKLLKKQKGLCAICKNPESIKDGRNKKVRRLSIDHCHNTGKVRGLLCFKCNAFIAWADDSVDILKNAIKYLKAL